MIFSKIKVGNFIAPDYRSSLGDTYYSDFCNKFQISPYNIVTLDPNLTRGELRKIWKTQYKKSSSLNNALCSPQLQSRVCGYRIFTYDEKFVPYPSDLAPAVEGAGKSDYVIYERLSPYEVRASGSDYRLSACVEFCRKRLLVDYALNTYFYIVDIRNSRAYMISVSYEDRDGVADLNEETQLCAELIKYNYLVRKG